MAAAEEAVARGWHVFPVEPDRKRPYTPHGWKDATPDASYWPRNCNVGIACGPSGLLVVDMDVKHNIDGVTAFEEWAGGWPDTYEVETPSSGVHLYFTDPAGHFGNGLGSLPKQAGIDIRGRGGYVLGAGSIIDSKRYSVVNDTDPLPLPDYLVKGLSARSQRKRPAGKRGNQWEKMLSFQVVDALNRILNCVAEAPEGERNNILYWAACRFDEAVAAGRITEELAEDELLDAAHQCGLVDDDGEYTVLATIESGLYRS